MTTVATSVTGFFFPFRGFTPAYNPKTRAQSDEDSDVRYAAVQELARGWKEDPETLPILKAWADVQKRAD